MSQMLEMPDELYESLETVARETGKTPVEWIAARLPKNGVAQLPKDAKTLADLFEGHIGGVRSDGKTMADVLTGRLGKIHSGSQETLSENTGEKFTDYLEQKRQEGRL